MFPPLILFRGRSRGTLQSILSRSHFCVSSRKRSVRSNLHQHILQIRHATRVAETGSCRGIARFLVRPRTPFEKMSVRVATIPWDGTGSRTGRDGFFSKIPLESLLSRGTGRDGFFQRTTGLLQPCWSGCLVKKWS